MFLFVGIDLSIDLPYDVEEILRKLDAVSAGKKNWWHLGRKLNVPIETLELIKREDSREGGSPTKVLLTLLGTYKHVPTLREIVVVLQELERHDIVKDICLFFVIKIRSAPKTLHK